ncbi:hypothetical protein L7F22_042590 [Adiantum nelumboides]|nr:hypothetical protein [Adiantum nelumboides]
MMHGKLCVTKQLRPKVLIECHAPPYAGHRGIDATVKAVDTFFYWPTLRRDVDAFVRSCLVCQKVKFDRQKAPGLLQPLPIPDKPWESIAMDFIFYLPRTPTGNDGIWTIICRFSKQAHFVPVRKKIKSDHMVKLFMHNIFKYHGMPQSIVSDRNPRMTSLFWKALFENMGTTLKFSSSFHPQTDGQSEEANSTILDLLKCYVSEHKATWEHYLPLVEYAYNNTVHTSTGKAPFEIVEGGKKVPPILQTKDKIFEADKYVQNMDEAYRKIKLALEKTQSKQKKAADRHRRELVFSLGDWVLLRFEKARLRKMKGKERLFPKLGMRYYGPFQICDKISDVAYRLKLPEGWKIHNAFHVSLLRPFVGDVPEDMVPEEQPEVEELDEILVPEQILAHKDRKVRGKVARRYLVKFKNYSPMDAKWMEEAKLLLKTSQAKANAKVKDKIKKGDMVLRKNSKLDSTFQKKFQIKWQGPFLVLDRFPNGTYQLADLNGTPHKAHVNGYKYYARLMVVIEDAPSFEESAHMMAEHEEEMKTPPFGLQALFATTADHE